MAKQDRINDLLTQHGTDINPADIAEVIHDQKTVDITPAPMPIQQAVDLYKRLDDPGKGRFIDCFTPDDQDTLLKALDEVGELIYTPGGLHLIVGTCINMDIDTDADPDEPCGEYIIETDARTYRIYLNLPLGEQYVPENKYPALDDRVVIYAESLGKDTADANVLIGYAESCWLGKTDAEIESLKQMEGSYVVAAASEEA